MKNVALISGANRGLGLETSRQLLELGYTVVLTSRDFDKGKLEFDKLKSEYTDVFYHQLDVASEESIRSCFDFILHQFNKLDVLVNNAGINYDTWHYASDANLKQCKTTLDINLFGPWRMVQIFLPLIEKSKAGRIVNVSSGAGSLSNGESGAPGYSVSKAGLNMLTIKLAHELSEKGILTNAVCPGWVRTDMGGSNATRSLAEGAKGIVWAATLKDDGPNGGFFRDGKIISW